MSQWPRSQADAYPTYLRAYAPLHASFTALRRRRLYKPEGYGNPAWGQPADAKKGTRR